MTARLYGYVYCGNELSANTAGEREGGTEGALQGIRIYSVLA